MAHNERQYLRKLPSLTLFFPFFNDAGTVKKQIEDAYIYGPQVANKIEVIAIHGGNSKDLTWQKICETKKKYPDLVTINKNDNIYGYAVIREGFLKATSDWVFYTDGDRQYHVKNLIDLVKMQNRTNASLINGCKKQRDDSFVRIFFGKLYVLFFKLLFRIPLSDPHCDFRLIRRKYLEGWRPYRVIGAEIITSLLMHVKTQHIVFSQVYIPHYHRTYGKTNYSIIRLISESIIGDIRTLVNYGHSVS